MWSDRFYYLNIYKDNTLSSNFSTKDLKKFLKSLKEFEQTGKFKYQPRAHLPFAYFLLLNVDDPNNWSDSDTSSKITNLIPIVCSKGDHVNFEVIKPAFIKIASFLNWKLIDERTD